MRIFFTSLVFFTLLSSAVVHAFSTEPGLIEISTTLGKIESKKLSINNSSPSPITLNLTPANIKFANDGSLRFISESAPPANWISISKTLVQIPAYSQLEVDWSIAIPNDTLLTSAYGAILIYQQVGNEANQVAVTKQLATLVFIDITNNSRKGMSIVNFKHTKEGFLLTVANSGNSYIRPHGKIEINNFNPLIVNQDFAYILPDNKKTFILPFDKWGWYEAKVTLEADGASPVYEIITFANIPWTGIIGICLLLFFLAIIWYRFRKSKRQYR